MSRNQQKGRHHRHLSEMKSDGSLDITVSLSSPRSGREVSWSSSDGSSYDTMEDLAQLQRYMNEITVPTKGHETKFGSPLASRNGKADKEVPDTSRNKRSSEITMNEKDTEDIQRRPKPPKSRLLRPFSNTNLETGLKSNASYLLRKPPSSIQRQSVTASATKRKYVLDNVEVFSALNLASGKEDVSTICFLSKEETDEVFMKRVIPMEVAMGMSLDEISAVSTSIAGSTESLSLTSSEEWSQRAVHRTTCRIQGSCENQASMHILDDEKREPHDGRLESTNKFSRPRVSLSHSEHGHILNEISISRQRTVSSLESSLTWDSQQDSNNFEGNGSEDAVRGPLKPKNPSHEVRSTKMNVKSLFGTNFQHNCIPATTIETANGTMDDKIKKLKEKIKSLQRSSFPEMNRSPSQPSHVLSHKLTTPGDESLSIASTISGLPSEALTTYATSVRTRVAVSSEAGIKNSILSSICETGDFHDGTFRQVPSTKESPSGLLSFKARNSASTSSRVQVPQVIPVNDLEDISLIGCDVASHCPSLRRGGYDAELGQGDRWKRKVANVENDEPTQRSQLRSPDASGHLPALHETAMKVVVRLHEIIQSQRNNFEAKSNTEKAVTVLIGVGLLILFILLLALIA